MTAHKVSEYVYVAEAARILGVAQGTVRAWSKAGKLPMHKNPANGYRLFKKAELEESPAAIDRPVTPHKPK